MLLSSLLAVLAISIVLLGREVRFDLNELSTAQTDDIRWNMSQLEVELLQVQLAARGIDENATVDLAHVRKRFDIFYSRIATLSQSPLYDAMRRDPEAGEKLAEASYFLDRTTPLIDGTDDQLIASLPQISAEIDDLLPKMRTLALIGVENAARNAALRRESVSSTLLELAWATLGLIVALMVTILVLGRLYRAGQIVSNENKVVKSRFEAAVKSSLDAVLVVDTSGQIIEFNGAAESIFGYTRDQAIGNNMAELIVPPHLRDMHHAGMKRFLDTGEKKVIGAGRVRLQGMRKSGEFFPVELSISLAETEDQVVFVSFLRDITRELEAEEELRAARDKAQAGEQAKSDLLTVMSHEMRTPLNGILGSLSLIERDNLTDRQNRHLNSIEISGELLLSHVNDVLDLSRLDASAVELKETEFDLPQMITQLTDSMRTAAEQYGSTLTLTFLEQDLGMVEGYQTGLKQCLMNLIGNAIKFTRDGDIRVEVEWLAESDLFEFRISDTGIGISAENLERIFDEFVTIDTAYARENQGTGLGLAITRRLVESMNGEIEADSIEGEGSLFTLKLPLKRLHHSSRMSSNKPAKCDDRTLSDLSVLVVEDNEINRMILKDMLLDMGCDVTEVVDGYHGLQAAKESCFDLIFLDISMPGLDGIETLRRIREQKEASIETPAIAVTAHAAPKDHDDILAAQFDDILVKPILPDLLEKTIMELVGRSKNDSQRLYEEDNSSQFVKRFGREAFETALADFLTEITDFRETLEKSKALVKSHREDAHRMAGSAAVLGLAELQTTLQEIETCEADDWATKKLHFLSIIDRLAHARRLAGA